MDLRFRATRNLLVTSPLTWNALLILHFRLILATKLLDEVREKCYDKIDFACNVACRLLHISQQDVLYILRFVEV